MEKELHQKVCVACEGTEAPLTEAEITPLLSQVSAWQVEDNIKIKKEFTFKNFSRAINFVNQVAKIAEKEGHHPDVLIHSYKKVLITLSTHAISGLSENDFILASKIDRINLD